jgi:hypothetical protein
MRQNRRKSNIRKPKNASLMKSGNLFADLVLHVHKHKGKGLKLKSSRNKNLRGQRSENIRSNASKHGRMVRSQGKNLEELTNAQDGPESSIFRSYIIDQQKKGRFELRKISATTKRDQINRHSPY